MTSTNCTWRDTTALSIWAASLAAWTAFVYAVLLYVHARHAAARFHHNFRVLYACLIISYIVTCMAKSVEILLPLLQWTADDSRYITLFATSAYVSITFVVLAILAERTWATFRAAAYEQSSHLWPSLAAVVLCYSAGTFVAVTNGDNVHMYFVLLAISAFFNIPCAVLVCIANRRLSRANARRVALTEMLTVAIRYQINENVRALLALLIYVIVDAALTIWETSWQIAFGIFHTFTIEACSEGKHDYFIVSSSVSCLMLMLTPALLFFRHPSYKIMDIIKGRAQRQERRTKKIVSRPTADDHFMALDSWWRDAGDAKRCSTSRV